MQTTFALPMRSFRLNENHDTVAPAAISFGLLTLAIGYNGTELIVKFRLPTIAREVDRPATVEHTEAVFQQQGLQYPADISFDENDRDESIRHQAREVVQEQLIIPADRLVTIMTRVLGEFVNRLVGRVHQHPTSLLKLPQTGLLTARGEVELSHDGRKERFFSGARCIVKVFPRGRR